MNDDKHKKGFFQGLTHFGSLLKEAILSSKEIMTEVDLVEKSLNLTKSQLNLDIQLEKDSRRKNFQ